MTLATPLSGRFVIGRVGHAMINLPTKFKVLSITRYGDMKCAAKFKNGVVLGGSGSRNVIGKVHNSIEHI